MPAIVSTNVTVTITHRRVHNTKRHVTGTIAFGDGVLTYPTAGVPLPTFSGFSFLRQIDSLNLNGVNHLTSDYAPSVSDQNRIQLWCETTVGTDQALIELSTAAAPAARTYSFEAWGW